MWDEVRKDGIIQVFGGVFVVIFIYLFIFEMPS